MIWFDITHLFANFFSTLNYMRTYLTLLLDTRRAKKDGSFPIIFRLTHLRKTTSISTGYSILEKFWDTKKCAIKKTYTKVESIARLNTLLLKEEARANDIINQLYDKGKLNYLSITQVKNRITRNSTYDSFCKFGEALAEDLKAAHRYGTARSYTGIVSILRTFTKGKDLKFNELNYDLIKRFERYHFAKGKQRKQSIFLFKSSKGYLQQRDQSWFN